MEITTHSIVGVSTAALVATVMPNMETQVFGVPLMPVLFVVPALLGSIAPDYDLIMMRLAKKKDLASKAITAVNKASNVLKPDEVKRMTSHRGITHTLVFPLIFTGLIFYVSQVIGTGMVATVLASGLVGLIIGWLSHIVADMFNKKGSPIGWPVIRAKIHIATFKSGTWQEWVWLVLYLAMLSLIITNIAN